MDSRLVQLTILEICPEKKSEVALLDRLLAMTRHVHLIPSFPTFNNDKAHRKNDNQSIALR